MKTNRELINQQVLDSKDNNILIEFPTGYGKSKTALDLIDKRMLPDDKILIIVPRLVLIKNWKDEFIKWGYENYLENVTFVTYISYPKMAGNWDIIVYDEIHHLSERCRQFTPLFKSRLNILLSATVKRNLKYELNLLFKPLHSYKVTPREAIKDNILPDPTVYLIPMYLDNRIRDCKIIKNKGKGNPVQTTYEDRWKYKSYKGEIQIACTASQYYSDLSNLISWYKNKVNNPVMKNIFLQKSGERLKWLSNQKTGIVFSILNYLGKERTLTFCSSIIQTEMLGKYCINSKNKNAQKFLNMFNNGRINHITAVNMLDEGVNLSSCRIGIYATLNSSERLIVQKLGRLLRHKNPIIIIPYYKFTRDEELVKKMCENYNPELIKEINDYKNIKL